MEKVILAFTSVYVVCLAMTIIFYISKSTSIREKYDNTSRYGRIQLPINDGNEDINVENFLKNDKPTTLKFENINYKVTSPNDCKKE